MNTPWDAPQSLAVDSQPDRTAPVLYEVRLRFGLTLSSVRQANGFCNYFRLLFPRSCATASDHTAWCVFRCAATGPRDAAVQAAAAVRAVAAHKLVREQPRIVHIHDLERCGPVIAQELPRAIRERQQALRTAALWGLDRRPLAVDGAEPVRARRAPVLQPAGQRVSVRKRFVAHHAP